jgi:hypothetical protein
LRTFVAASENPVFIAGIRGADQYGGWLPSERIRELAARLVACEPLFVDPAREARDEIIWLADLLHEVPATMLRKAYADAREMLQAGIESNGSLVLLLD